MTYVLTVGSPPKKDTKLEVEAKPRGPRPARLILSLLAAAAMLVLVFWLADLEDLARRLATADYQLIGLALVLYSCTYVARARRFAAAGAKAGTWTLLCVVSIHGAMNRLLPLKTGELAYPVLAKRIGAAAMGEGLVQLLMLRLLDLLTLALLFLIALAVSVAAGLTGLGASTTAFVIASALLGLSCLLALWRLGQLLRFGLTVGQRLLGLVGASPEGKPRQLLEKAAGAVTAVTDLTLAQRLRLGFWSVACWVSYYVMFHLILLALDVPLPFLRTVLGSSAAIVGSVVPVSGLGTFGALEGGWTAGFVAVGVDAATAASTALVMSGLTLLFALALAAIGWVSLGMRREREE